VSRDHYGNWLDCIKSRAQPNLRRGHRPPVGNRLSPGQHCHPLA
jgi:hypothetical protein